MAEVSVSANGRVGLLEVPRLLGRTVALARPALAAWRADRQVPPAIAPPRPARQVVRLSAQRWRALRRIPPFPWQATVPLDAANDVILYLSSTIWDFHPEVYAQEVAFATEFARHDRPFAVATDPTLLFEKNVVWAVHANVFRPRVWDHNRQVCEFAAALERQHNSLFCSRAELELWENKAEMHRRLNELGIQTPPTVILTAENWRSVRFDFAPVLLKEEHSAGSTGIHYFESASEARHFVSAYAFRPGESLIMQEVVPGATRDVRITVVGDSCIDSACYWRIKSPEALSRGTWSTTATTYNSLVDHSDIPPSAVRSAIQCTQALGLRIAGVDLMWCEDDVSREPLILEISPAFQPNPPKPARYRHLAYKAFKNDWPAEDGYLERQYHVRREIAGRVLDQGLI